MDYQLQLKSSTQKVVTLSVTEADLYAATSCAQELMPAMQLRVKLPMILQCNNKGTIDLSKNWSMRGRTQHVDVRMYMLHDINVQKLKQIEWVDRIKNSTNLGTKYLDAASHKKHTTTLCSNNNEVQPLLK